VYKTELCAWWMLMRCCSFGDDCVFAHGVFELRGRRRPLKYKTKICENIASYGSCPYGWRCHFIHPSNDWVSSSTVDSVGRVEELLGGKLSVESELGAGTTIQVALPVGVDGTPPGKPRGSESSKRSPGPTGVMPAEEIFVSLLASIGHTEAHRLAGLCLSVRAHRLMDALWAVEHAAAEGAEDAVGAAGTVGTAAATAGTAAATAMETLLRTATREHSTVRDALQPLLPPLHTGARLRSP